MRSLSRTAWLVVALLWPVALLNYLDRQMLAAMKFSVMADIPSVGLEANWGYMLGQFKWVYAFFSPIGGYVADRFSRRYTIAGSLFVWSAITWLTGQVSTYEELLWTRTLMGISEAFYIPAALALIADYHVGNTRSRAVGLHQMAIYCGVIVGGFSGYVADAPGWGWRSAFDITGLVGILYAFPLLYWLKDAPRNDLISRTRQRRDPVESIDQDPSLARPANKSLSPAAAFRELFTNVSFLLLVAYFTLPAMAGWVVRDWMPAILKERFAIGQGKAGVSATLFVSVASLGGAVLGGWLADTAMRRSQRGRIIVSAVGMALLTPALFGMGHAGTLTFAIMFLMLFGLGWGFFDCNNMPILSQIVRPELRATGYGIMNMVSISGGGFADWGFGILRDQQTPLKWVFGIFAGIAFLSIILVLLIKPRITSSTQGH